MASEDLSNDHVSCPYNNHDQINNGIQLNYNNKNIISDQCSSPEVTNINLTINENNVIDGAREVLKVIRPKWNSNDIKFKVCMYDL